MDKTDVLVIGGSAAGLVSAAVGKSNYPDKDFLIVRRNQVAMIPCGIPYLFGSLESSEKNVLPDGIATNNGARLKIAEVTGIDRKAKVCKVDDGTEISFEKLIIATGSTPYVPRWLNGTDLINVFSVPKVKTYLDNMSEKLAGCGKIVVVGAGFIGVELSDEIRKHDKEVTLVEVLPHILGLAFDEDIATNAETLLVERGVNLKTNTGVKELTGNGSVSRVLLDNGESLEADAVVLSMGYRPNTELAQKAGFSLNEKGFIKVDEYLRTEDPDIFAVGDCAEKRDFITRKENGIMLASTACVEARIAGMNLYKLSALKTFNGTIAIYDTVIGDTGFGTAGVTEAAAKKEGFDVVTGTFTGIDRHPGTLPDAHKQTVKLIVSRECGVVIGGQSIGGLSTGEFTNLLGIIIQNKMTLNSVLTAQIGTQPCLTASPAAYPLIKAAEAAAKRL
jgi:NADPH-dependent 2,4-dienoyl-CoA reductase/sulfur reductase-like enzyme